MSLVAVVLAVALLAAWLFTRKLQRVAEERLPPAGQFMDVDGARLHYVDRGVLRDGPAIVMLHGLAGQLHNFGYSLVDDLAQDTRVIALDRPGSGYSTRRTGHATTLFAQADAIEELCRRLNLGRVVFVGHSLGGALSLAVALRHRERVAALALIAPLTTYSGRMPKVFGRLRIRNDLLRRAFAALLATPLLIINRDRIMPQIFGPESVPADYAVRAGGLLSLRTSQFVGASQDLGALPAVMPEIERRYPDLNVNGAPPIGVLYGRHDRILDAALQCHALASPVPHVQVELVDGGHMLPITQPEVCARFIRECWQRAREVH